MTGFKNTSKLLLLGAAVSALLYTGAAVAQDNTGDTAAGTEQAIGQMDSEENVVPEDTAPDADTESENEKAPDENSLGESAENGENSTEESVVDEEIIEENGDNSDSAEGIIEVPEETILPVDDSALPEAEDASVSSDEALPAKKAKRWWGRPY